MVTATTGPVDVACLISPGSGGDGAADFEGEPGGLGAFLSESVDEVEKGGGGDRFVAVIGDEVEGDRDALEVFPEEGRVLTRQPTTRAWTSAPKGPAHGTAACSDGRCTYTPAAGFRGDDTFTYTVSDPSGATATGTVKVTVAAPGLPVAADDSATGPRVGPFRQPRQLTIAGHTGPHTLGRAPTPPAPGTAGAVGRSRPRFSSVRR